MKPRIVARGALCSRVQWGDWKANIWRNSLTG